MWTTLLMTLENNNTQPFVHILVLLRGELMDSSVSINTLTSNVIVRF
jgi:hypothetical protein